MVSTKFGIGIRVWYKDAYTGLKIFGIIGDTARLTKQQIDMTTVPAVWAYWNQKDYLTWIGEDRVNCDEFYIETQLKEVEL